MGVIAAAVVGIAAAAGGAYLQWDANDAALDAQEKALNGLQFIDIDQQLDRATEVDTDRYRRQFEVQREIDPQYAALRDRGAQAILRLLAEDSDGGSLSDRAMRQVGDYAFAEGEANQSFIDALVQRAKEDLDAGATLPPEFQAELIKAGLEGAGTRGESIDGRGAAGTSIRQLVGSAGLDLKERRENNARTNLGAAESLRGRRAAVLQELAVMDNNLRTAKGQRATGALTIGNATVPAIGLTGADAVNLSLQNINLKNQQTLGLGDIKAQKRLAEGQMYSQMTSAVASGVTGMMGGGGGMGGMVGGGGTGGGSSWISGLMGGGGQQMSNAYGSYSATPNGGMQISRSPQQWNQFYSTQALYQ
ncbi:MAG TPA: hypothetical protein VEH04_16760 [Verrucomicrobiae bacterium]|nr:hypothetical protein [Verrucomicrobiae bacterium]